MTNEQFAALIYAKELLIVAFNINSCNVMNGNGADIVFRAAKDVLSRVELDGPAIVQKAVENGEYDFCDLKNYAIDTHPCNGCSLFGKCGMTPKQCVEGPCMTLEEMEEADYKRGLL